MPQPFPIGDIYGQERIVVLYFPQGCFFYIIQQTFSECLPVIDKFVFGERIKHIVVFVELKQSFVFYEASKFFVVGNRSGKHFCESLLG
jgi:hypothetical protein